MFRLGGREEGRKEGVEVKAIRITVTNDVSGGAQW